MLALFGGFVYAGLLPLAYFLGGRRPGPFCLPEFISA